MASRIILKEPGTKEELWFDPDDTKTMCHIEKDYLEYFNNNVKLTVDYAFDNDESSSSITIQGTLNDTEFGDNISDTCFMDQQEFARQLMQVAYTEGSFKDAQMIIDSRKTILSQFRDDYLLNHNVLLDGYDAQGFGYVYVGKTPVMTVEKLTVNKYGIDDGRTMILSHCAGIVDLKNVIAPLSMRFTVSYGSILHTFVLSHIPESFQVTSEKGWLNVSIPLSDANSYVMFTSPAEAVMRPDEITAEKNGNIEKAYQERIWHLSKLENGITTNDTNKEFDDSIIDIFDL